MKKFAFLLLMSVQLNAQTVPTQLPKFIQDVAPKVIEMRRYFHQFPELSNREFQTAAKIEAYMKDIDACMLKVESLSAALPPATRTGKTTVKGSIQIVPAVVSQPLDKAI